MNRLWGTRVEAGRWVEEGGSPTGCCEGQMG